MTTTPIANDVQAELTKLLELGFSEHQARTIITAREMRLANESKTIQPGAPRVLALLDSDGDSWRQDETGKWRCTNAPSLLPRTREEVETAFGPVTEVYA